MKIKIIISMLILCMSVYSCSGNDSVEPQGPPDTGEPDDGDGDGDGNNDNTFTGYYVSAAGSDDNQGTFGSPYASVNYALNKTKPGDTVYVRGGTYREKIVLSRSGATDRRIVLTAYGAETPVIDGEGMEVIGPDALIRIGGVNNVTVHGFEVTGFKTSDNGGEPNGIIVDAGSTNITVSACHVHHIESNITLSEGRSAHAILVMGNTETPLRNILIEGNTIHDCKTGYSENLTINGYVDGFTVRANTLYNCENIAIDAAGGYSANTNPAYNYVRNGVISENTVFNVENSRGPIGGYGAIGIYADGSRYVTIERNRVYDCDRGIGVVSETDSYPTTGCIVRNNLVYNCWRTGIYTGGYLNYTGGGTSDCYIINNTLVANNKVQGYYEEIEGELRLTENSINNHFYNNLICSESADDLFVHKYTSTGSGNVFDNNMYCGPGGWMWESINTATIYDFEQWKSACAGERSSVRLAERLFPDVVLNGNADLRIPSDSPAKNGGKFISNYINGTFDFAGNPRSTEGTVSIGAYQ